ncbi:MAG: calcium/sodium antiporter, partial [Methanobacteriaceae archaeon]|nr:calcium/sodium antiporter [Methanobacteriaceae archaeon]
IGSNIWNIAGILGITAAYVGLVRSNPRGLTRDGAVTLITALILVAFMFMGSINKFAGIIMIAVYAVYLWILVKDQKKENISNKAKEEINDIDENSHEKIESPKKSRKIDKKIIAWTLVGLAGLIIGCRLLIYSGVELATMMGVPAMIMGLFTLAIGTSIPELVVTFSSAMKGLHDLSIGNILGSNTFNIMIGIGIPALIMDIPVEPLSLTFDAPAMILVTILVLLLIKRGMKLTRTDGIILMATYIAYAYIRLFVLA